MSHSQLNLEHGQIHNTMLVQAIDTVARTTDLPPLMQKMLKDEGWRVLIRPADGKRFENKTLADWILGPPWAGLKFHNWATLYGILKCNVECGSKCIDELQRQGAPSIAEASRALEAERAEKTPLLKKGIETGRGMTDRSDIVTSTRGNSLEYTLRRLKRDHKPLFAAYERGELSAHAAAIKAGFRKKPAKRFKSCPYCGHELP